MELILTLLGIIKYLVIGLAVLKVLQKLQLLQQALPIAFTLVLSFLFGIFVSTILLHAGLLVNLLPYSFVSTWIVAIAGGVYLYATKSTKGFRLTQEEITSTILFTIGFILQCFNLSIQPVIANDARGIWLLKTKAILAGSEAFTAYLQNSQYAYSHTDYPITMPLLYADIIAPLGNFWEPAVGVFSFVFFFLLLISIYGSIRYFTKASTLISLFMTAVIFFTPEYARQGWAGLSDVPLSLVFLGTLLAVFFINKSRGLLSLLPLFMLAGLAATIKNEGQTFLVFTILIALGVIFTKFVKTRFTLWHLFLLVVPLLPIFSWKVYTSQFAVVNDLLSSPNLRDLFLRIPTIIAEIAPRLLDGYRLGILFIPALLLSLLPGKKNNNTRTILVGILLLQSLMYIFIYLITPHDVVWHISTSLSRLILHLLPSIYLLAIYSRSSKNTV